MSDHVHIPGDIAELYEVRDHRHAAAILACEFPDAANDVFQALRSFRFTKANLLKAGGNESEIPKIFSQILRPLGWKEAKLNAKLVIDDEAISADTHKIDYIKDRIAFSF